MKRISRAQKRSLSRSFLLLCFLIIFIVTCFYYVSHFSLKADAKGTTIRVGYIDYSGFIQDTTAGYEGYGVDYLNKIAEYTNWNYEYVYDTWEDCLKKLEQGEIDLLCTAQYTKERAKRFAYSEIPLGYESMMLYVTEDSDIYYDDRAAMNGKRVGLLIDSFQTQEFYEYAEKQRLSFSPVYYRTEQEIVDALGQNEIDMAAVGSLARHPELRAIGRYGAEAFYCITQLDNTKLVREIDDALRHIKVDEPALETELTQRYYGVSDYSNSPLFTREEHEYIQQAGVIPIHLAVDAIPLSYVKNGENHGIFVEYLHLLEKKSGLTFQIQMDLTKSSMRRGDAYLPKPGSLTIRSRYGIAYSMESQELALSRPIFQLPLAYVKRQGNAAEIGRKDYTFALTPELGYLEEMILADSPDFQIFYYDTAQECMEAVWGGDVDIVIQDSPGIAYWMQRPQYTMELLICPGKALYNEVCLVANAQDQILIDILSKTINYISDDEKDDIVTSEILMTPYERNISDLLYEYRHLLLGVGTSLLVAALVYAILLRRMLNLKIEKREYERLQKQVQQDSLTGVYNRKAFYDKAREMIEESNKNMCVVILDVVNFKVVNDLYGMANGDRLLQQMAQSLLELCRNYETIIARFNGDHFYLCMSYEDFQQIPFPKRYRTFMEDMDVTVVYGVFVVGDQQDVPVNIMCDRASIAAHNESQHHLNYIRYYSDQERSRILQEQEIVNDMEKALEERQFCIYVQPKYDISDNQIMGAEALVRWIHPKKGLIPPGKFIHIFEKNGFILRLDYYIWEEACRLQARLKELGLGGIPISVNVSRVHFYGKELIEKLQELISQYRLDPSDLELEITETICADDPEVIRRKVRELQAAGFKVAMDDFGSGYSSLNMLKEMPLDILKMDLKFLDGGDDEERSRSILGTLIHLAHSLHLEVVVEGVETKDQVDFLRQVGNRYVQGYFFSRPVQEERYQQMLEQQKRRS